MDRGFTSPINNTRTQIKTQEIRSNSFVVCEFTQKGFKFVQLPSIVDRLNHLVTKIK